MIVSSFWPILFGQHKAILGTTCTRLNKGVTVEPFQQAGSINKTMYTPIHSM